MIYNKKIEIFLLYLMVFYLLVCFCSCENEEVKDENEKEKRIDKNDGIYCEDEYCERVVNEEVNNDIRIDEMDEDGLICGENSRLIKKDLENYILALKNTRTQLRKYWEQDFTEFEEYDFDKMLFDKGNYNEQEENKEILFWPRYKEGDYDEIEIDAFDRCQLIEEELSSETSILTEEEKENIFTTEEVGEIQNKNFNKIINPTKEDYLYKNITYINHESLYKITGYPHDDYLSLERIDRNTMRTKAFQKKFNYNLKHFYEFDLLESYSYPQFFICNDDEYEFISKGTVRSYNASPDENGQLIIESRRDFIFEVLSVDSLMVTRTTHSSIVFFDCNFWFPYRPAWKYKRSGATPVSFEYNDDLTIEYYDKAIILAARTNAVTYFHILVDELPMLFFPILKNVIMKYDDVPILVSHDPAKYKMVNEWFDYFGIDKTRLHKVQLNSTNGYFVNHAIIPISSEMKSPHPTLLHYSRSVIFRELGLSQFITDEDDPYIVVVKRAFRGIYAKDGRYDINRAITNHDEMMEKLKLAFPSETFVEFIGNLTQPETAKLFNKAKIIIAPHGAGTANIVYAASNSLLLEINTVERTVMSMYALSRSLGMGYFSIFPPDTNHKNPITTLNIDDVVRNVKIMLYTFEETRNF
eukprot:TRINITY_DN12022_c0_g1_i1.p1 TRINITY_DN12022_c0_g1~~TRINITY_DN12022_c0_g1_i1.p1  ORF type:complete len:641 (+),score=157.91 TRINITY_DN12022_c0_g1_i1:86-2008(+)